MPAYPVASTPALRPTATRIQVHTTLGARATFQGTLGLLEPTRQAQSTVLNGTSVLCSRSPLPTFPANRTRQKLIKVDSLESRINRDSRSSKPHPNRITDSAPSNPSSPCNLAEVGSWSAYVTLRSVPSWPHTRTRLLRPRAPELQLPSQSTHPIRHRRRNQMRPTRMPVLALCLFATKNPSTNT